MYNKTEPIGEMGLKIVAVDSVNPSDETFADGSYPLLIYTCSYYNSGSAKGKTSRIGC